MLLDARTPGSLDAALSLAAACLRSGGLVGLPTETVYGLGADADNPAAVAAIFAAKGRPADHPLIIHVADGAAGAAALAHFASSVPPFAQALAAAFWPGPLTMIVPRRAGVAQAAAGGQDSIGLRCPAHPVALALLRLLAQADASGAINMTAPVPVTNTEFTASLARALHRPACFAAPAPILKLALGERSLLLLGGQRVLPTKAEALGYDFVHRTLDAALQSLLT